jgi:hypothetical protein
LFFVFNFIKNDIFLHIFIYLQMDENIGFIIIIVIIIIIISFIVIITNNYHNLLILPPRNEAIYILLLSIKSEIIESIINNNYTYNELNNKINNMTRLYINHKCDFIEDYNNDTDNDNLSQIMRNKLLIRNYKIQIIDIERYILIKRGQIIRNIIYKLKLLRKNELMELMIFNANLQKELLSSDEFENFTLMQFEILQKTLQDYHNHLLSLFYNNYV